MTKTKKTESKRWDLIFLSFVVALITSLIGSCVADNNTFNESRKHWDRCSAWIIKFRNPYAGNYVKPSEGNLKWFIENCEGHTKRKMPRREDKSTWYLNQ